MNKTIKILSNNVFGDGEIKFNILNYTPNYSNPHLNIEVPIFTIHGNHDYPSHDLGFLSAVDILHNSHLVNFFGKHSDENNIVVEPIIFLKGKTKIALYGIGY